MLMYLSKQLRKNKKGFTLIELIVVIAILAILAMIAVPRLAGFQDKAREANDRELGSIVAHSVQTLIASGELEVAGADSITIGDNDNDLDQGAVLDYAITGTNLTIGPNAPAGATIDSLLQPLIGDDKEKQRADMITINIEDDGDVPVDNIGYDWIS